MRYAHIIGWGCYLPERILTNDELATIVDTSNDWIFQRTGIRERRIAAAQETTATLAFEAAARALAVADIPPSQIDLIIVATSTPEYMFPSTAALVQDYLGASKAGAFDMSAACSGFIYALHMGSQAIASGSANTVMVIGSEVMSRVLDWTDRGTCVLFGDGAGAVVLKGSSIPGGVMAATLGSDGSGADLLALPALYHNHVPVTGVEFSSNGHHKNIVDMDGKQVFRFATNVIASSLDETLARTELSLDDISLIIPHQANARITEAAAKKMKVPADKFYMNIDRVGNTSAASIPIALCEAIREGRLRPNDNVALVGFGGGLTWASAVVKWDVLPRQVDFPEHEWQQIRYVLARGRSRLRRVRRQLGAYISRTPEPGGRQDNSGD